MKKLTLLFFCVGFYLPQSVAADSAVILMYHRFGETQFPSTNIRLEQLNAHINELKRGPYTVLPVAEIVSRIKSGKPLPDRTVGITVDDGFKSVYEEAWPRFEKANLPFTVFYFHGPIRRKTGELHDLEQCQGNEGSWCRFWRAYCQPSSYDSRLAGTK